MVPTKPTGPNAFCLAHLWHPPESTSSKSCVPFQLKEKNVTTLRIRERNTWKKIIAGKSDPAL